MLYFITPTGLVSEDDISNRSNTSLKPIQPFIEIPLMKRLSEKDLCMGNYDFSDDTQYYQPAIVDNVIIRKIKKIIKRNGNYAPDIFYIIKLQWFSVGNYIGGERIFNINNDIFNFDTLFSKVIPFINRCMVNKDKNIHHHIFIMTRLMGIRDGFNALFDPKVNSMHASYYMVRNTSIGSEFKSMKVSCHYSYQYRVGRDDYESEHMTVKYKTNSSWYDYCCKSDKNYLQDLLYDTIKRKYQTQIEVKKDGEEYSYTYRSWSDYNYGPSQKDFDYSEEDCKKMKDELIEEINKTFKLYYDDFVEAYKAFLDNTAK